MTLAAGHELAYPSPEVAGFGLGLAYKVAVGSPDPSTQNGAVIASADLNSFIDACNRPPRGVPYDPAMDRDHRMLITEHAERAAIHRAARYGVATDGATMFCPWAACAECARAIVDAGIILLVRHQAAMDRTPERWRASIEVADRILDAGGVRVWAFEGLLGGPAVRHNGVVWFP